MLKLICNFPFLFLSFVNLFKGIFSNTLFLHFKVYLLSLCLDFSRFNLKQVAKHNTLCSHQQLQYFISEAKWDVDQLNTSRLAFLSNTRQTTSTPEGVLSIDDTANRKWGKKSEGVAVQYSNLEKHQILSQVAVMAAYADHKKSYPLDIVPYIPASRLPQGEFDYRFKSKHQIAQTLVQGALDLQIRFRLVRLDAWYFANWLVQWLSQAGLSWLTEADSDRLIYFHKQYWHVRDLVKVLNSDRFKHKLRAITVNTKTYWVYRFVTKINDLPGKYLVVVSYGDWEDSDRKVRVFVSNNLTLESSEVSRYWGLGGKIESLFWELKGKFHLDRYQYQTLKTTRRHWHLSILAYTFVLRLKLTGALYKYIDKERKLNTLGDCLNAFRDIVSVATYDFLNHLIQPDLRRIFKISARKVA
jgi:hypothetical protein